MSMVIKSTAYSNALSAYAVNNQTVQPKQSSNNNTDSLVKLMKEGYYNFDRYEAYMDDSYRDEIIEDPNLLLYDYRLYLRSKGFSTSVEDKLAVYEELREEILKAFENDTELMNAHLQGLDNAFEYCIKDVAFAITMKLWAQNMMARQYENEGIAFEAHKLATNMAFNKEEFGANAENTLKEFGQAFLNNIRNGLGYADAKKSAFDYMEEIFKTTSVNNLSLKDLMVVGNSSVSDKRVEGKAANIAQFSELNKKFNNSTELSAELRELLG